jgi:hypothetical protein
VPDHDEGFRLKLRGDLPDEACLPYAGLTGHEND